MREAARGLGKSTVWTEPDRSITARPTRAVAERARPTRLTRAWHGSLAALIRQGATQTGDSQCWRSDPQPVAQRDHPVPVHPLDMHSRGELTFGLTRLAFTGE